MALAKPFRLSRTPYLYRHSIVLLPRRHVHTSQSKKASAPAPMVSPEILMHSASPDIKKTSLPPLAILPTSQIARSYLITRATSSPLLLSACFVILKRMLDPKAVLLSPERNPFLRWLFKHTFYAQFCAGENKGEVQKTIKNVKDAGYTGVILEYALEVLGGEEGAAKMPAEEIEIWRAGMLETVDMSSPGDFIALKWSGIGKEALKLLDSGEPPTEEMHKAIIEVCDLAAKKDAALLPGAELEVTNIGIDSWTIELQRKYNKATPGKALMYTTYQSYLRSTPSRIARDLAIAQKEGFTLGIKLVRGAYLLSEKPSTVWSTMEETHVAYDAITSAVLTRTYNDFLKPADPTNAEFPNVAFMMASHNATSVAKARDIRAAQAAKGEPMIDCTYAQLQGMADEISCGLVAARREKQAQVEALKGGVVKVDVPRPYKCATWGTIGQCLNFLYRRALENKDAAGRTAETRKAMAAELWRRSRRLVGIQ